MKNILDTLRERGFIKQVVFEEELYEKLSRESVSFYVGYDPTADSLHVGHFLTLMAMSHMQKAGHKPYILIGGGTGKIGDPSGRSDMRQVMTDDIIAHNCDCFREQMKRFISFEGDNGAVMVNNDEWLSQLNFLDFMRDIGVHFSVNQMLTKECYKSRMEKGLTFLEFSYMLMQAYDFLYLYKKYGITLECGGDDQWPNILAGADLIRRKERKSAFAMTFTLLLTSEGKKMGKTQKGALWLDKTKTSPYDFYQYWRNIDDGDVEKCFKLLTFLPLDEIAQIMPDTSVEGFEKRINAAKERLAYEITKVVHGEADAREADLAAKAAFGGGNEDDMISVVIEKGISKVIDILCVVGAAKSKSEARRLIEGGGIKIGDERIADIDAEVAEQLLIDGVVLHKGKKMHIKISR